MKRKIFIEILGFIIIILGAISNVYAATGTVSVTSGKTELDSGDTFKVNLSGKCDEGINGLEAVINYDNSVFELIEANVSDNKWINLGQNKSGKIEVTVICNSTDTITNSNMFVATFKVREGITGGKTSNISITGITLHSDTSKMYNSENKTIKYTIGKAQQEEEKPTPKEYTVTFNTNGGNNIQKQTVVEGNKVNKPANPTKEGYTFENWYSDIGLNTKYDFNNNVTSNITLYAKWNKIETKVENKEEDKKNKDQEQKNNIEKEEITKKEFTVTFNTNGGNNIQKQTVVEGNKVNKPANPTKEGYTFENWYSDVRLNTKYDFNKKITSNITLYAKWNEIENKEEENIIETQEENKEEEKVIETQEDNKEIDNNINDIIETYETNKEDNSNTTGAISQKKNNNNNYLVYGIICLILVLAGIIFYIIYRKNIKNKNNIEK